MKKWVTIPLVFLFLVVFSAASAAFYATTVNVGARPLSMGKAYVGLCDGPNTSFFNPAGLTNLKDVSFTSMYTALPNEVTYTLVGGVLPSDYGNVGWGYLGAGVNNILITQRGGSGRGVVSGAFSYADQMVLLSYGRKMFFENLSVGATLKLFHQSMDGIAGGTGTGMDMDLGLLWKPYKDLSLGVNQQNTLPFSLAAISWGTGYKESIPSTTRAGMALYLRKDLLSTLDVDITRSIPPVWHGGMEWQISKRFSFRGGLDQVAQTGAEVATNYTLGVGLKFSDFVLDYAYYINSVLDTDSLHYFSISYREEEEIEEELAPSEVEGKPKKPGVAVKIEVEEVGLPKEEMPEIEVLIPQGEYLLAAARQLMAEGKYEEAREKAIEYLAVNPWNSEAKEFLVLIDKKIMELKRLPQVQWVTYQLKQGDTLWTVAREKMGDALLYKEIKEQNAIEDHYSLRPGRKIKIPVQKNK